MVSSGVSNSKRLVKNTLFLYIRTAVNILIGLYTSRVILSVLGVTDYGINSVVGGVVALSGFFTSSMISATTRQITFALGQNDKNKLNGIFSCCQVIHYGIAVFVFILAETVGLWFLNTHMSFPTDRIIATNWIYQLSLLTALLTIVITPYNSAIIAHEDFAFSAYAGIGLSVINLITVIILQFLPTSIDYLIIFGLFQFFCQTCYNLSIYIFSKRNYKIKTRLFGNSKENYKSILSFSLWTIFGSMANVLYMQGINVLFNVMLNLTVNAAMGIANQINSKINVLVGNFQQAFNPQLTKLYAKGDISALHKLIFQSSKLSFLILFIFAIPVIINIDFILHIWLGKYPDYSASLASLILVGSLIETLSGPLWISLYATGRIKFYQVAISAILLLNLPLSYITLRMGFPPSSAILVRIMLFLCGLSLRLILLKKYINLSILSFSKEVILPILLVLICSCPLFFIHLNIGNILHIALLSAEVILLCAICFFVGLKNNERLFIRNIVLSKIKKNNICND